MQETPSPAEVPALFYVVDAKGDDLKVAWTDASGRYFEHPLTLFQATCLIEDLGRGLRKRVRGGW